jgi:hypothetical protein
MGFGYSALPGLLILSRIIGAVVAGDQDAPLGLVEIVESDVCIIGGGSSGTYSAIRLKEMGKTVTLIEKQSRLGGHVNTYVDPATGASFDYGVIAFDNSSIVRNYFAHFNIPLVSAYTASNTTYEYANFKTGEYVSSSSLPSQESLAAALLAYLGQLAKYPYISKGFDLPSQIPEDFLLTWGDFIEKYQLGGLSFESSLFLEGVGNILAQTALYMLKYLGANTVNNILTGGFVTSENHNNQELYNKALAELGSSAFISSNVTAVRRSTNGVQVDVSTPSGPKTINASKLLIAIDPKLENLGFLDLAAEEKNLFGQFNNSYYWDAIVKNTAIPNDVIITNVNLDAPYEIPSTPGIYRIVPTDIAGLFTLYYTSPSLMTDEEVQADILATIARLEAPTELWTGTPEFVEFNNHSPFELTVSSEAIKGGFYGQLNKLQGERSTWWTGAAWQAQDSSQIWNWTEINILPKLAV